MQIADAEVATALPRRAVERGFEDPSDLTLDLGVRGPRRPLAGDDVDIARARGDVGDRHEEMRIGGELWMKVRGRDADDRVGPIVDGDRPLQHVGPPAKVALPELVAHDGNGGGSRKSFFRPKPASERHGDPEHLEEIGRDRRHRDAFGAGFAGHDTPHVPPESADRRQPARLRLDRDKLGRGDAVEAIGLLRGSRRHRDELLRRGIGQGLPHLHLQDADHRRDRANADGQRRDRQCAESRLPPHEAKRMACVADEVVEEPGRPDSAGVLEGEGGIAQRQPARAIRLEGPAAASLEAFTRHLLVKLELVLEVGAKPSSLEPIEKTTKQRRHVVSHRLSMEG